MSFLIEKVLSDKVLNRSEEDAHALIIAIQENTRAVLKGIEAQPEDIVLLQSNNNNLSSAFADGAIILASAPCPPNHTIKITDWNINFTTAAGTVRVVILDANNQILYDVLRDISSSTNGTGSSVLQNGQRLAIAGQSSGAGTFGCFFSAVRTKLRSAL